MRRYTLEEIYSKLLTAKTSTLTNYGSPTFDNFIKEIVYEFDKEEQNETYTKIYKDDNGQVHIKVYDAGGNIRGD